MQCIYLRKRVTLYVGDGCEALSRMMIPAQPFTGDSSLNARFLRKYDMYFTFRYQFRKTLHMIARQNTPKLVPDVKYPPAPEKPGIRLGNPRVYEGQEVR
jgi:hypothetical protein